MSQPEDPGAGKNPEYGASLHYFLKEPSEESEIKIEILDAAGRVVRALGKKEDHDESGGGKGQKGLPEKAGINRVFWDLRFDKTDEPKLRTQPVTASL